MNDLRFPTALQMVLSVALADRDEFRCTSQMLADGLNTNPSFIRKLLIPLTREGMITTSVGKGGGLHLGRAAEEISLRDIYHAVTEQKRVFLAREDLPPRCRISANINEFFGGVTDEAERAMLEVLSSRGVAQSLDEILALDKRSKRSRAKAEAA
ncbi:Rrf2 family transcriptional regulator [Paraburkholderia sediminicola]|uniref:Rrf2 family transcriptional regulator n=1 Tax=Paraburkholderia sediminicola TaxID=458836 RepID=UPI0038BAA5A0